MSSIPDGACSKETFSSSRICNNFLTKPISLFIKNLLTYKLIKPVSLATPTTVLSGVSLLATIIVPGADGLFVFFIQTGISFSTAGISASSWKTENSAYDNSLIYRYVNVVIVFRLSTIFGFNE